MSKSFGTYAATYISSEDSLFWTNLFALGILGFFVLSNIVDTSMVAKSESFDSYN